MYLCTDSRERHDEESLYRLPVQYVWKATQKASYLPLIIPPYKRFSASLSLYHFWETSYQLFG